MKYLLLIIFIVLKTQAGAAMDIYQFKTENIDGKAVSLSDYKGKVLLLVNTASQCGYTPQYAGLEAIYEKYKKEGLVILGFPSNDFGGQEPGSNEEIKTFCDLKAGKYKISFPMFAKSNILSDPQNPIYSFLTQQANVAIAGPVKWNFEKFLISKKGALIARFSSKVTPDSPELISALEKELKAK